MKSLSIVVLLSVALSAQTLSVKDWDKKSDTDQLNYLGLCVAGLTADVAKTDPALAQKIKSWYSDKRPGQTYTDGTSALLTRLFQLVKEGKEGKADLSRIEVEDVVYRVTAEKFKLPPRQAPQDLGDFESAGAPTTAPPSRPIMVGKVDVSHFAGLKPGDPPARVVALYGKTVSDQPNVLLYVRQITVEHKDGAVRSVAVFSGFRDTVRSRAGNDALLDLFGHSEAEVIALLGPAQSRQSEIAGAYYLFWDLPAAVRSARKYDALSTGQTLVLEFRPGSGCSWVSVRW